MFRPRFRRHPAVRVARLSALFALDAFGGGFVMAGVIAYWFNQKFNTDLREIGRILFWANVLAGISALSGS